MAVFAEGLEFDINTLIQSFIQEDNISFENFCYQWNNNNFCYIFHGLRNLTDQTKFMESCLNIVKTFLLERNVFLEQICTLYLYYALFFKQPAKENVKMRLTLSEWDSLKAFYSQLAKKEECAQAKLIFWKLIKANAFHFVAQSQICDGLTNIETLSNRRYKDKKFRKSTVIYDLMNLKQVDSGIFQSLKILEVGYNEMKNALTSDQKQKRQSLPPSTFVSNLEKTLDSVVDILGIQNDKLVDSMPSTSELIAENVRTKISKIRQSKNTLEEPKAKKKKLPDEIKLEVSETQISVVPPPGRPHANKISEI